MGVGVVIRDDDADRGVAGVLVGPEGEPAAGGAGAGDGDGSTGSNSPAPVSVGPGLEITAVEVAEPETAVAGEVLEAPAAVEANFTFSASVVSVGEEVTFESTSVGPVTAWSWTFGDGTGASGPVATKSWSREGTYGVTLIVDGGGTTDSVAVEIQVLADDVPAPPRADFRISASTVEVGEEVVFTSTSTGEPTSLVWEFGDGSTATGATVRKTWTEPGTFRVNLVASNRNGSTTRTAVVEVVSRFAPPVAQIVVTDPTVEVGEVLVLVDGSTNQPTSSSWDFGRRERGDGAVGIAFVGRAGHLHRHPHGRESCRAVHRLRRRGRRGHPVAAGRPHRRRRHERCRRVDPVVHQHVDRGDRLAHLDLRRRHHREGTERQPRVGVARPLCGDADRDELGGVVAGLRVGRRDAPATGAHGVVLGLPGGHHP